MLHPLVQQQQSAVATPQSTTLTWASVGGTLISVVWDAIGPSQLAEIPPSRDLGKETL